MPEHTTMTSCHWRYELKKIAKIRSIKFRLQGGRCYYCCQPMWCEHPSRFADAHGLSAAKIRQLQATAEHLLARCEGGRDTPENIVAACRFCNTRRHLAKHPLAPEAYARKVRSRLSKGLWHGVKLDRADELLGPAPT